MRRRSRRVPDRPAIRTITVEGIDVEVTPKRIKHLHIRVQGPEGRVRVSAPVQMDDDAVHRIIVERLPWIRKQQERLRRLPRRPERRMLPGESHSVWGDRYVLDISRTGRGRVELRGPTLFLIAPKGADEATRRRILDRWYRDQMEAALPSLMEKWVPRIGERVVSITIRRMKTRWGSCTPVRRTIRLNVELATRNPRCLEYVLVHELVHLLEASHNARFYALMDHYLPGWQAIRHELNHGGRDGASPSPSPDGEVD